MITTPSNDVSLVFSFHFLALLLFGLSLFSVEYNNRRGGAGRGETGRDGTGPMRTATATREEPGGRGGAMSTYAVTFLFLFLYFHLFFVSLFLFFSNYFFSDKYNDKRGRAGRDRTNAGGGNNK